MWLTIERTFNRLFSGHLARPVPLEPTEVISGPDASAAQEDLTLAIGRHDVQRLALALQGMLGPDTERPDTPARLESALAAAVERLGGGGRPRVTRRPPGLYTPEAWQVQLVAVRPVVTDAIRGAIRTGTFE